ncbi:MAG TPA: serine/threonine-protein kinase [Gemmataceae bacterium]|nr:serine/threonine-protein kinase [Gemmataceae bacterium]
MLECACPTDEELAAFAHGRVAVQVLDRLAEHLTGCPACQRRLEHAESTADPVVRLLRRSSSTEGWNQASPALALPRRQLVPHPINVPSAEESGIRLLYYRRLRLGFVVVGIALLSLWFLRFGDFDFLNDSDSFRTPVRFLFAVLCLYACAIAAHLWLRPTVSLARLRQLALVFFGLWTVALGYRQYAYLAFSVPGGRVGPEYASLWFTGANAVCILTWFIVIANYGVLVPDDWRRVLAAVAGMALISLATILAAGIINPVVRAYWPELFTSSAVVLSVGVATATNASYQIAALRRAASEARRLGQYQLKERLGAGGMGEVYLAEHRLLKRPCAVKLIRPDSGGDAQMLRRFEREVQATSQLTHPNTVAIYDYGHAEDGTFYYVMEYLPGLDLDDLVAHYGPLPPARAVHFLRQLCGALQEAHAAGLVHRDIKPGNVLVCRHGGLHDVAKLLDFGLVRAAGARDDDPSRLTAKGAVLGTPAYMAPEQARGAEAVDARSDLYSLGALGYFLLAGRPPFQGGTALEVMLAHVQEAVPPLANAPADLEAVLRRCLAKAPAERFPDARSLDEALAGCACAGEWTEARAWAWWQQHRP